MPSSAPDPVDTWQVLVCPSCKAKSRIRAAVAHRKVLCPRCKTLIPSLQPNAAPPNPDAYGVSAPEAPPPPPPESPRRRRARDNEPEEEAEPELPPRFPLWQGVYGFPWHAGTLRAWFMFGIGFSLVALMAAGLHYVIVLYETSSEVGRNIWFRVLILFMKAFVLFLFWTGAFAAEFFLTTIQDTAAGIERIRWPDEGFKDKFFRFLYLVWIFVWAAVPLGVLVTPLKFWLGLWIYAASLVPTFVFVFPLVLLSVLANDSGWMFVNGQVFGSLLRKPLAWLQVYLMSFLLLAPCVVLGWVTIEWHQFFLVPVTGYVWSACWLIHGRLLGRLGWVITGAADVAAKEHRKRARRAKKRVAE
jgi:hypothetical protein